MPPGSRPRRGQGQSGTAAVIRCPRCAQAARWVLPSPFRRGRGATFSMGMTGHGLPDVLTDRLVKIFRKDDEFLLQQSVRLPRQTGGGCLGLSAWTGSGLIPGTRAPGEPGIRLTRGRLFRACRSSRVRRAASAEKKASAVCGSGGAAIAHIAARDVEGRGEPPSAAGGRCSRAGRARVGPSAGGGSMGDTDRKAEGPAPHAVSDCESPLQCMP